MKYKMDIYEAIETAEDMIIQVADERRNEASLSNYSDVVVLTEDLNSLVRLLNKIEKYKSVKAVREALLRNYDVFNKFGNKAIKEIA